MSRREPSRGAPRRWWAGLLPGRPNEQEMEEELRFHRTQLEAGGKLPVGKAGTDLPEDTLYLLILRTLTAGAKHRRGVFLPIRGGSRGAGCLPPRPLYPRLHPPDHAAL